MIVVDCIGESEPKDMWLRGMKHMHGILLRRLGKKRVVYLVKRSPENDEDESSWHSNVNLVTGVSEKWLNKEFGPGRAEHSCAIAGRSTYK